MKRVHSCSGGGEGGKAGSEICGTLFCVGGGLKDRRWSMLICHVMATVCGPCRAVRAVGSVLVWNVILLWLLRLLPAMCCRLICGHWMLVWLCTVRANSTMTIERWWWWWWWWRRWCWWSQLICLSNLSNWPTKCTNSCFIIRFIRRLYMFRALCAHHHEVKIVLCSIWYRHNCRWPSDAVLSQPVHRTVTYRCDDTRCCIMQFWPPDDEHIVLETCRGMK